MEDKTSSKLKSMLDSKKIRNIIIVVGLIGIGLIFLSNWVDFGSLTSGKGDEAFSVKTYSTKIENDLQTVISKIEGAGKTEVLLTMENSVEYVYLDIVNFRHFRQNRKTAFLRHSCQKLCIVFSKTKQTCIPRGYCWRIPDLLCGF